LEDVIKLGYDLSEEATNVRVDEVHSWFFLGCGVDVLLNKHDVLDSSFGGGCFACFVPNPGVHVELTRKSESFVGMKFQVLRPIQRRSVPSLMTEVFGKKEARPLYRRIARHDSRQPSYAGVQEVAVFK